MIRLFKSYNIFTLLLLFAYGLVLRLDALLQPLTQQPMQKYPIIGSWLQAYVVNPILTLPWLDWLLGTLLVTASLLIINLQMLRHKIAGNSGLLFSFMGLLLSQFVISSNHLNPIYFALPLLSLGYTQIFECYFKTKSMGNVYNAGLVFSLAALIYFPFILLAVFAFIALLNIKKINLKEALILALGLLTLYYFVVLIAYLTNHLSQLFTYVFAFNLEINVQKLLSLSVYQILVLAILIPVMLWGLYKLQQSLFKSLAHNRKFNGQMLIWFAALTLIMPLRLNGNNNANIFFVLTLAYPMSYAMLETRRPMLTEIFHLFLFVFAIFLNFQ